MWVCGWGFVCACACARARAQLSGMSLPDWGFRQREVVAEKLWKASADALDWTVEEHRYGISASCDLMKEEVCLRERGRERVCLCVCR